MESRRDPRILDTPSGPGGESSPGVGRGVGGPWGARGRVWSPAGLLCSLLRFPNLPRQQLRSRGDLSRTDLGFQLLLKILTR